MTQAPSRNFHLGLIFLVALNLIPHISMYTLPVVVVGGTCILWRLLYEFQKVRLPHYVVKFVLVAITTYWVYLTYGRLLGLESGSALLVMAISLKLIDRATYHDAMILLFLVFMLLLARVLESQTLWMTLFGAFDLVMVTALLVQLHSHRDLNFSLLGLLRTGGKLLLQVSPFMFLLFFVFPRFSSSFGLIGSGDTTSTGFSKTLKPGAISKVIESDEVAFRVRYEGDLPPPVERYWRGEVLGINNGMIWLVDKERKRNPGRRPPPTSARWKQEILLEPRFRDWLFVQDVPLWIRFNDSKFQGRLRYTPGKVFSLKSPINNAVLYTTWSTAKYDHELTDAAQEFYLKVPEETDPRMLELAEKIKGAGEDPKNKAKAVLKFFSREFRYSLEPGAMSGTKVTEFVFDKKVGFCEHFAISFAYLMRMAGVPSRVVIGFQGGQLNEMSDYLIVKDKDAHAWTEIWSAAENRWLRYDPTQVVAPLRLELGGDIFYQLTSEQLAAQQQGEDFLAQYRDTWTYKVFGRASLALDALATRYNYFMLTYNRQGQQKFLNDLGLKNLNSRNLLIISVVIFLIFYFWIRSRNRLKKPLTPAEKAFNKFCLVLSKKGIERQAAEGPSAFILRAQQELPDQSEHLEQFRVIYLPWRYSNQLPVENDIDKVEQIIVKLRQAQEAQK